MVLLTKIVLLFAVVVGLGFANNTTDDASVKFSNITKDDVGNPATSNISSDSQNEISDAVNDPRAVSNTPVPSIADTQTAVSVDNVPHTSELEGICSNDQICFSHPKGCNLEDCDVILSLGNVSFIYVDNFNFLEMVHIYCSDNGVQDERVILIIQSTPHALVVNEPYGITYITTAKFTMNLTVINEEKGQYLYTSPGLLFKTGENITYAIRYHEAGMNDASIRREQLFFVKESTKPKEFREHAATLPYEIRLNYNRTEENQQKKIDQVEVVNLRAKKESPIKTVDFYTVWRNRMIFI
ncbi:hypothetical protein GCK72_025742 [Caenorhabditis remanei]|uniref:Phlebovirus glycoprotein G2 fusion domain-containing protein n=1 Tax=Caenorhabditis remanei TaxID=31234 RepID=A0A6A5G3I0_CAERE|nr:hypothetical protein GCK72_025742 [Caenorhabditis remanei]KAF1749275.1 hypothetical protein GCK72_025742 [Caenorhabditis remanei]